MDRSLDVYFLAVPPGQYLAKGSCRGGSPRNIPLFFFHSSESQSLLIQGLIIKFLFAFADQSFSLGSLPLFLLVYKRLMVTFAFSAIPPPDGMPQILRHHHYQNRSSAT